MGRIVNTHPLGVTGLADGAGLDERVPPGCHAADQDLG